MFLTWRFSPRQNTAQHQFMKEPEVEPIALAPASPWRLKQEIADYYRCDVRTISNLMRRRILPFVKIGRLVRFNVTDCDLAMSKYQRASVLLQRHV